MGASKPDHDDHVLPRARTRISRGEVVQRLLGLYPEPRYLEVGVSRGLTFHEIEAPVRVAVDPHFRFDASSLEGGGATFHEVTSDEYFGSIVEPDASFDVIYLDGMHTLEQTLRDLTNALVYLKPQGVLLLDDVYPSSYVAAVRDIEVHRALRAALKVKRGAWMGDVYRLVFFISSFFQQYSYATVEENHGQLVVWRDRRASVPDRRVEEVGRLPYESVVFDREAFRFMPLDDIVALVTASWR